MASWPDFRPAQLLHRLAGVDFVVVGGVAVAVQASPRPPATWTSCHATDAANLQRLGALLVALDARLRDVEGDLPFVDARTLARTQILTLTTREGPLDPLVDPPGSPGSPGYAAFRAAAPT